MKKVTITAIAILMVITGMAQSVKNYTLGKRLKGSGSTYTTVGGLRGTLLCTENEDDIINTILFIATELNEDGETVSPYAVSDLEAAEFAKNVEGYYRIKFEKSENESIISYQYTKDNIVFHVGMRKDMPLFSFTIEDKTLQPVEPSKDFSSTLIFE